MRCQFRFNLSWFFMRSCSGDLPGVRHHERAILPAHHEVGQRCRWGESVSFRITGSRVWNTAPSASAVFHSFSLSTSLLLSFVKHFFVPLALMPASVWALTSTRAASRVISLMNTLHWFSHRAPHFLSGFVWIFTLLILPCVHWLLI